MGMDIWGGRFNKFRIHEASSEWEMQKKKVSEEGVKGESNGT